MREHIRKFLAKTFWKLHCYFSRHYITGVALHDIQKGDIVSMRENDNMIFRSRADDY